MSKEEYKRPDWHNHVYSNKGRLPRKSTRERHYTGLPIDHPFLAKLKAGAGTPQTTVRRGDFDSPFTSRQASSPGPITKRRIIRRRIDKGQEET